MSFMYDRSDIAFPEEWSLHTIEDVAHFARELSWAKRDETDKGNGSLVVSIPNIRDGYIDFESKFNHYLACKVPESKQLSIGDIVFVGSSGSLQNVGRNAKVRELPGPSVAFASFTFKATPDQDVVDPDFFYYLVNSDLVPFADYCSRAADGKFNFQLIDFKSKQQLRLPRKKEQQSIVEVLSTVQQAIEQQERLIRTTTELKQALMQKLFTEGLHGEAQKETEIGAVPESWEVKGLGDLDLEIGDGNYAAKYPRHEEFISAGVPFLRAVNIKAGRLQWKDMRFISPALHATLRKGHVKQNDVILVTRGSIGEVAFVTEDFIGANMNAQLVRINGQDNIDGRYLYFALLHEERQKQFRSLTTGTALQQLPIGKLKSVLLPVPSLSEQQAIGRTLALVEAKAQDLLKRRETLQDLFRTLLHELMTGKVRVGNLMP
jgi:restriction endonuclease S subunit